jgi:S1-C subfamily serine protease
MRDRSAIRWWTLCFMFIASPLWASNAPVPHDVTDAIVKIYTYHDMPDYQSPWSMRGTFASTASGCVIKGKRILTNAHVVSDETFIQVRRYGQSRRVPAKVVSVSHAADLALLTVDDPEFFEGVPSIDLGVLPSAQQEVTVCGFPLGGDTMSITKGVISRIEHATYAHSSCNFLACQIDAAINPGNSGGPALVGNHIVGVAMQGISQADNIGYIVPVPIIEHFLNDLEDGHYDGFPSLGLVMEGMENPDIKKKYGMEPKQTGMLAVKIVRGSPAESALKEGDVLLSVEGHPIADDGTVDFRDKERTSVSYYIQAHQVGGKLPLEVLRDGKPRKLEVTLNRSMEKDWLIPNDQYDVLPRYYIFGGLLFCPLTVNYLKSWGPNWYDAAPQELVALLGFNYVTDEREEIVLVSKVLAAPVNQGYQEAANWIVTEVDGGKIRNLKELVDLVEKDADPFVVFKNKWGHQIVLDRAKVRAAQPQILATYRIPEDRSPDLRKDRQLNALP